MDYQCLITDYFVNNLFKLNFKYNDILTLYQLIVPGNCPPTQSPSFNLS
jgi:hypothetical protein